MAVRELINAIFDGIVDGDYVVKINLNDTNVELAIAKEDIARVIGKGGRTAAAIRTIVNYYAKSINKCIGLNINELREENQSGKT
ncbi:MAG: KH domain-containing protein [Oscillospiraceae bacterium]|jgi:predicted RNA-binding protein YlqC (UPF0109 family)|nr:KH domain-containing protein [Oscillospiraceae bacterium]